MRSKEIMEEERSSFPRGAGRTTLFLYLSLALPTQCHPAQTLVHFLDAPFLFCQYLVRATAKGVEVKGKVAARGKGGEGAGLQPSRAMWEQLSLCFPLAEECFDAYMGNSFFYKLPTSPQTLPSSWEQGLLWLGWSQMFLACALCGKLA